MFIPKGLCTQIVYTLAPTYLYRDYIKAKVYTIWVHGPLGCGRGLRSHRDRHYSLCVFFRRLNSSVGGGFIVWGFRHFKGLESGVSGLGFVGFRGRGVANGAA